MFLLLYFYFWILTYFQHLINPIFLYRPLWLCNKLFSTLVAQTTTIIYYCSCFLWKGLHWASLGIAHAFAVRCWLGHLEGLTGGRWPTFRVVPSPLLTVGHESQCPTSMDLHGVGGVSSWDSNWRPPEWEILRLRQTLKYLL